MLPSFRDQSTGNDQRKTTIGRLSTNNGAATSMSTSCCVMCAEKSTLPHACSGDTSATNRASHPPAKHIGSQIPENLLGSEIRENPLPAFARLRRHNPIAKSPAVSTSDITTTGSKLHACASSCQLCG